MTMITVFKGDMEIIPDKMADMAGKVDFVFADPPYNITRARYDNGSFNYNVM